MPVPSSASSPPGCAVQEGRALARCTAELRGHACLLCRRDDPLPAPAEWNAAPGWFVVARFHVQAIHFEPGADGWAVVVFTGGRKVHPAFPPIRCSGPDRAIALAKARARQIAGRKRIVPFGRDGETWSCGDVWIGVADSLA